MSGSGDTEPDGGEIWGTWEELLLACAVGRHGTRSWDSVAHEVQARSPFAHLLTPHRCRLRFHHLRRRFSSSPSPASDGEDEPDAAASAAAWVEELRKLRVAELRREVERYDLSIVSLQLKVKRLKEERERSLRETESGEEKRDLKQEERNDGGSPGSAPEDFTGDGTSGGDSGGSCKESNSTDLKQEKAKPGGEGRKAEEHGVMDADPPTSGGRKAAGEEESFDGSSGVGAENSGPSRPQGGDSGESATESEEEGRQDEKESSDVQSSASLSRRRKKAALRGRGGGGGEASADEVSALLVAAGSQPLMSFLDIIRSSEHGSIFERRLENQEGRRYRSMIRRHVDFEIVQAKLERGRGGEGAYTSDAEFFRDLLLLCANATVFYPQTSPESVAATHLRELVSKQIATTLLKPALSPPPPQPPADDPLPMAEEPKADPDLSGALIDKPIAPAPIFSRKRSSITKAAAAAAMEENPPEQESEEKDPPKKTTKERPIMRGLRSKKSRGGSSVKCSNPTPPPSVKPPKPPVESAPPESAKKPEKKGGSAASVASVAKKRNAVDFLNRMNRSSVPSSSRGQPLETLKKSAAEEGGGGRAEKKAGKGEGRKEQTTGGSSKTAPAKRSVGRPPKRAPPLPAPPPAKRAREEAVKPAPASRKRGRK